MLQKKHLSLWCFLSQIKNYMDTLIALRQKVNELPFNLREEACLLMDRLIEKSGMDSPNIQRKFGSARGKIHMSDDFDKPLTELFKDYS